MEVLTFSYLVRPSGSSISPYPVRDVSSGSFPPLFLDFTLGVRQMGRDTGPRPDTYGSLSPRVRKRVFVSVSEKMSGSSRNRSARIQFTGPSSRLFGLLLRV